MADLSGRMKLTRADKGLSPITFLIGAGCSVSAGVPSATTIARNEVVKLALKLTKKRITDPAKALIAVGHQGYLKGHLPIAEATPDQVNWGQIYDALFAEVHTSPAEVSHLFKALIRDAKPRINWAHLALGELARLGWIATTITTNFDLLALEGYARAGVIPVVSDGLESLDRIDPRPEQPQLLQINGSVHSYRLRNSVADLDQVSDSSAAITCFRNLFQSSNLLVVVGYEGREPQIMRLLTDAANTFRDKHIFWCLHSSNPDRLSERAAEFLSHSVNARLIPGQDADAFFHALSAGLGIGAPLAFRDPLGFLEERLDGIYAADQPEHSTARDEIAGLREKIARLKACDLAPPAKVEPPPAPNPPVRKRSRSPASIARALISDIEAKHSSDPDALFDALRQVQDEWFVRGRDKGISHDLEVSLALAEHALTRARTPDQRGAAQNILGNALGIIGEREMGTSRLEAAVVSYAEALKDYPRDRVPLDWAMTQNNLGTALQSLGDRETGTARLEAAVAAYGEALKEYTRDRVPLDWGMTQNNLGAALTTLGKRETGTARLEAAVAAYAEALKERTRDRVPLDWAMTQHNLGEALQALGEREAGTVRLEAAVAAYAEALKEYTRDRVPLDWAESHGSQGAARRWLADRTDDHALSVTALQQLTEAEAQLRTGGHVPLADHYAREIPIAKAVVDRLRP